MTQSRAGERPRGWVIRTAIAAAAIGLHAAAAQGQPAREPIGLFAADARVALPGYKANPQVASALEVDATSLPTRGFGLVFGAHLYPARKGVVTFGIGGEVMMSRRSRTPDQPTSTTTPAPTVETRFSSISPQVSLNFGARQGWSYLSAGLGLSRLSTERADRPPIDSASRVKTINYGGGARWFAKEHLAFSVDLRFYVVNPQEATLDRPAYPRTRMVTFSAGLSVK